MDGLDIHPGNIDDYMPEVICFRRKCFKASNSANHCTCSRQLTTQRDQIRNIRNKRTLFLSGRRYREFQGKPRTCVYKIDDTDKLVQQISVDLSLGKKIAIGLEAPMWSPVSLVPRFIDESGHNAYWWNPTASAATVSAIQIGIDIFIKLKNKLGTSLITPTTDFNDWAAAPLKNYNILLYEGFINGKYKLDLVQWRAKYNKDIHKIKPSEEHIWDAFLVGTAFWDFYLQQKGRSKAKQKGKLHPITYAGDVFSHWNNILMKSEISYKQGHSECVVLSLE